MFIHLNDFRGHPLNLRVVNARKGNILLNISLKKVRKTKYLIIIINYK